MSRTWSLQEQRRLFYVALTRTTETLVLSSIAYIPMQETFQLGLGEQGGGPSKPAPITGQALLD